MQIIEPKFVVKRTIVGRKCCLWSILGFRYPAPYSCYLSVILLSYLEMSIPSVLYVKLRGADRLVAGRYLVAPAVWSELTITDLKDFVLKNLCTSNVLCNQIRFCLSENSVHYLSDDTILSTLYVNGQEPGTTDETPFVYCIIPSKFYTYTTHLYC